MQTSFTAAQLADPTIREGDLILRKCVHCGFCTATCPTYVVRGDELDSPRGRIYLIKTMLESGAVPAPSTVTHIDRCLSCLSCMTTCPSGVDYRRLVDAARQRIEQSGVRSPADRAFRWLIGRLLTSRRVFRSALAAARLARPLRGLMSPRLVHLVDAAPTPSPPSPIDRPQVFPPAGPRTARVALLSGCVQPVLRPQINEATIRLLNRRGVEVVVTRADCCGGLTLHMGDAAHAKTKAAAAVEAWWAETADGGGGGLDAIVINTSGCGSTVKDYGHLLAHCGDPALAGKAEAVAALAVDVSEFLERIGIGPRVVETTRRVAYHAACSLQHGQRLQAPPRALLRQAGFDVCEIADGHLCCGAAGAYPLLQPALSKELGRRKAASIEASGAEIVATGNIGCLIQIGGAMPGRPVVHTVELLDWATGGPPPAGAGQG
jgi:glycolate oxidase iron-sulfur subunit